MESAPAALALGQTRWRRAWFVIIPALAIVAMLLVFIARGLIAVSFAISGTAFTVTADRVASGARDGNGKGFYQFGVADFSGSGAAIPQVENIIPDATIDNLCQSVSVGPLTLRITAGTGATPVSATNLIIDVSSLSASSARFTNLNTGQDMGTFNNPGLRQPTGRGSGPNVNTGPVPMGTFGQVADGVTLTGVRQVARATQASSFTLPNLSLAFGAAC